MSGGGFRKSTSRTNTTMPYNVGFLNDAQDTEKYNTAVYDELQKVSTASTHMFQAIDDVKSEIVNRTKALDAMKLTYDAQLQQITTNFQVEIDGIKTDISTTIGNLNTDGISDPTSPTGKLSGSLVGIRSDISDGTVAVTTLAGVVHDNTTNIGLIQNQIGTPGAGGNSIVERLSLAETNIATGKTTYDAQWSVKTTINGLQGGVGFYNNGTDTKFVIDAKTFAIVDTASGFESDPVFKVTGGKTYIDQAIIDVATIDAAQIHTGVLDIARIGDATITAAKIETGYIGNAIVNETLTSTGFPANGIKIDFKNNKMYMNSSSTGGKLVLDDYGLTVYDAGGIMRAHLGKRRPTTP